MDSIGEGCVGVMEGAPRSILVIMMSAVGDAVQVLPVVHALKRAFPTCRISWLIQPGPHALVEKHPGVDEFILFHRGERGRGAKALARGFGALRNAGRALRASAQKQPGGAFDLVLDLQVYFKAGVLTHLAPARMKLGFDWRRTRDLNWLFTTHRIPPHPGGVAHTQDQYLEFVRYLGVNPEPVHYGLDLTKEEEEARKSFFHSIEHPSCAMVVASSSPTKDWNPEGYVRVAEGVTRELGLQPILVGGVSPREEYMARRIKELCPSSVLDARGDGLRRLLWLLAGSRVVVSPDTGPLHMARALEVPVVGLYGTTNPKRSGPYRMFEELVVDGYGKGLERDYPITRRRRKGGMEGIQPEEVLERVAVALDDYTED